MLRHPKADALGFPIGEPQSVDSHLFLSFFVICLKLGQDHKYVQVYALIQLDRKLDLN